MCPCTFTTNLPVPWCVNYCNVKNTHVSADVKWRLNSVWKPPSTVTPNNWDRYILEEIVWMIDFCHRPLKQMIPPPPPPLSAGGFPLDLHLSPEKTFISGGRERRGAAAAAEGHTPSRERVDASFVPFSYSMQTHGDKRRLMSKQKLTRVWRSMWDNVTQGQREGGGRREEGGGRREEGDNERKTNEELKHGTFPLHSD